MNIACQHRQSIETASDPSVSKRCLGKRWVGGTFHGNRPSLAGARLTLPMANQSPYNRALCPHSRNGRHLVTMGWNTPGLNCGSTCVCNPQVWIPGCLATQLPLTVDLMRSPRVLLIHCCYWRCCYVPSVGTRWMPNGSFKSVLVFTSTHPLTPFGDDIISGWLWPSWVA